jgi:MOSC domain-containing protein YiiM
MVNADISFRIVSVQVGLATEMTLPTGGTMRSAIRKKPVHGPVHLGPVGLDGDEQANRKHHGGPDKAVCCFPVEHYPAVEVLLGQQISAGAFGENFTTQGLTESDICIGDCYEIAEALLEVSQPRQPCPTLGHRWHAQDLPRQMVNLGLSGWYLRVLRGGMVAAGMTLRLRSRPNPDWTVSRLNSLRYGHQASRSELLAACDLDGLSESWRNHFSTRLAGG